MNINLVIVSLLIVLFQTDANKLVCQLFDTNAKRLELYCEAVALNCTNKIDRIDAHQVKHLKIFGCTEFIVLDAVETYQNIVSLDVSHSKYKSLDWLDGSSFAIKRLKKFNASNNEIATLTMLTQNTPELMEIDLSHNRLTSINASTFGAVDRLVKIHLSHNQMKDIAEDSLANASNLNYIDLNDNHFSSIPKFPHNRNLKTLHIAKNHISSFNYCFNGQTPSLSMFLSFKNLRSFSIRVNCDASTPRIGPLRVLWDNKYEGVFFEPSKFDYELHCRQESFRHLRTFVADRNSFTNILDLLHCFGPSINSIDLSGNFVESLSANAFDRFRDLITLILRETRLIDFNFNALRNQNYRLQTLDISNNNLKSVKNIELLRQFHNLHEFYAAGNQIENAQKLIDNLQSEIQRLNLAGSAVGRLNATAFHRLTAVNLSHTALEIGNFNPFQRFESLDVLDISFNYLKYLNASILSSTLIQLRKFYAINCGIENASAFIEHFGPSLEELNLSGNRIGAFNQRAFELCTNLVYLNLSNTNLQRFNFNALRYHTYLRIVDVSSNKLYELDFGSGTSNVNHLYLNGNDLMKFEQFDRKKLPQLKSMAISNNQFACDYLKEFMDQWNDIQFIDEPLNQKHNIRCESRTQAVSDFFSNVYNKIKFW